MTATVAELADRPHRDVGYVLFIEGCAFAFTDRVELVGSGESSWIGTATGARRVRLGLTVPDTITYYTNPEHGMLTDDDEVRFELADFDDEIITWFEDAEYERAYQRLGPKDDPAPATLQAAGDAEVVNLHGRCIGVESIGAAGERRQFQLFPGDPLPGYDHAALSVPGDPSVADTLAPVGVFDAPPWIVGRKLALYLIFRDTQTDEWPSWDDHYAAREYSLIWWGTCAEMGARHRQWSMRAKGPSSWLSKMLNANRPSTWQPVEPYFTLKNEQRFMAVEGWYDDFSLSAALPERGNFSAFADPADYISDISTWDAVVAFINSRIETVLDSLGDDINWWQAHNAYLFLGGKDFGVQIRIEDADTCALARIVLHEAVWRLLGFDPKVQPEIEEGSEHRIQFQPFKADEKFGNTKVSAPGPDYYVAQFSTIPAGVFTIDADIDNGGSPRVYYPLSDPGLILLRSEPGQEIDLGALGATPYIEGQLNLPPEEYEMSYGQDVDAVGFIAFKAPYRTAFDAEPVETVQIAKVTWHDDGNTPQVNGKLRRLVRVEAWLDPRWFGIDKPKFSGVWAATGGTLQWCPLAFLGYDPTFAEYAHIVMLRTLLSTGTAGWTGFLGSATQSAGDNAHPDAPAPGPGKGQANDFEIADLGLGIYHGLVDWHSFFRAAAALPGDGALARCKVGKIGAFDSRELFAALMMPRGWQLGLRGGRYGIWQLLDIADEGDVDVIIGQADVAGDEMPFVEDVEFDPITPIDSTTIAYGQALVEGTGRELSLTVPSRDIHARTRNSNAVKEVENVGMVPIDLWPDPPKGLDWHTPFRALYGTDIAQWRARPHLLVKGLPLHYSKGKRCAWPGATISFTSAWPATRGGTYGFAGRVGRVVRATRDLRTHLGVRVDVVLEPTTRRRRFAPSAWVLDDVATLEQRLDAETRTFFCYADYYGTGDDGHSDVKYFAEPAWFGVGGDAKVYGYQYGGRGWEKTFEFLVESVSTTSNTITYQAGSFSGKFWERKYTMLGLAPYSAQPNGSWVREFFAFHTKPNGKMGAGNVQGFKLS